MRFLCEADSFNTRSLRVLPSSLRHPIWDQETVALLSWRKKGLPKEKNKKDKREDFKREEEREENLLCDFSSSNLGRSFSPTFFVFATAEVSRCRFGSGSAAQAACGPGAPVRCGAQSAHAAGLECRWQGIPTLFLQERTAAGLR